MYCLNTDFVKHKLYAARGTPCFHRQQNRQGEWHHSKTITLMAMSTPDKPADLLNFDKNLRKKKEWTPDGPLKIDLDPLKPRFQTLQGSMDPIHMEPGANPASTSTGSKGHCTFGHRVGLSLKGSTATICLPVFLILQVLKMAFYCEFHEVLAEISHILVMKEVKEHNVYTSVPYFPYLHRATYVWRYNQVTF